MTGAPSPRRAPIIGVFDSGFGGLTVLRALLQAIPGADFIYLGDTARLPYGSKSKATVAKYAVEAAHFLEAEGADLIVIACNTATALAEEDIHAAASVPVVGVIAPVVAMAKQRHPQADTLILATAATVQSHAYKASCESRGLRPTEKACPLLVPLIEEGWVDHPVTRDVLRIYLREALQICTPSVVILGCTHYPLIARLVCEVLKELGSAADVIDSAEATAFAVTTVLYGVAKAEAAVSQEPSVRCFATDSIEKFQRLGSIFLGQALEHVKLLDLGG